MTQGVSLLIVGYGARGRRWHREARRHRFRVRGVVDPDQGARGAANGPTWPTLEEALRECDAAAAVIASPSEEHPEDAIACLRAGLAVLVEKPLALSTADAVRVSDVAASTGRPALVGQNFRYLPREVAVRRLLERGAVGPPASGSVVSVRSAIRPVPPAGGVLWDFVLQHLDALRSRFGPPATATAEIDGSGNDILIRLEWAGGPTVVYHHREGGPAYHYHERLEGPGGEIAVTDQRVRWTPAGLRTRRVWPRPAPRPERILLDHLARAVETGHPGPLGVDGNIATVALTEAVARSASSGRPVAVPASSDGEVVPK